MGVRLVTFGHMNLVIVLRRRFSICPYFVRLTTFGQVAPHLFAAGSFGFLRISLMFYYVCAGFPGNLVKHV